MNRTPLNSTYAASAGYDASTMTLEVEHTDGTIYQYFDVPESTYLELMSAPSFGQYMHANIRNSFRYIKL